MGTSPLMCSGAISLISFILKTFPAPPWNILRPFSDREKVSLQCCGFATWLEHGCRLRFIANNQLTDPEIQGVIFTARDVRYREEVEEAIRSANVDVQRSAEDQDD